MLSPSGCDGICDGIGHHPGPDAAIGKLKTQIDELALANAASRTLPQSASVGAPSPAPGLSDHGRLDTMHARSEEIARAVEVTQQRLTTAAVERR